MNRIDPETFTQGSLVHFLCLLGSILITAVFVFLVRWRQVHHEGRDPRAMRIFLVVGCLVAAFVGTGFGIVPGDFSWSHSLPLQFCNLGTLIAAWAVATRHRTAQGVLYFWTLALSSWAYLTPSLYVGPAHAWFWIFWGYHLFILIALAWVVCVDRFRPGWADWRKSVLITLIYTALLSLLNFATGWNYGFLGPDVPSQRNLLEFLGPYPIRLVWMVLIGAFLFTLLMIPWMRPRAIRPN
jgi:hypothetical integral membrane protein (TIGR02206 family)